MKKVILTSKERIRRRIRSKVSGTKERPRLSVYRSNKYIYAQLIDDETGITLLTASDVKLIKGTKTQRAQKIGAVIAKEALKKKISSVVFDRGGFKYTGRIKSLAEEARKEGLKF